LVQQVPPVVPPALAAAVPVAAADLPDEAMMQLVATAAWAKRGPLIMLRRRLRQAWDAEMDEKEAAEAAAAAAGMEAAQALHDCQ
jgi:hypothetical protein